MGYTMITTEVGYKSKNDMYFRFIGLAVYFALGNLYRASLHEGFREFETSSNYVKNWSCSVFLFLIFFLSLQEHLNYGALETEILAREIEKNPNHRFYIFPNNEALRESVSKDMYRYLIIGVGFGLMLESFFQDEFGTSAACLLGVAVFAFEGFQYAQNNFGAIEYISSPRRP